MTLQTLTAAVRAEQRRQALSDAQLAAAAGVSQPTVTRWLGGAAVPSVPTLLAVLTALGRDLGWLHRQTP